MARRPDVTKEPVQGNAISRKLMKIMSLPPALRRQKGFFQGVMTTALRCLIIDRSQVRNRFRGLYSPY